MTRLGTDSEQSQGGQRSPAVSCGLSRAVRSHSHLEQELPGPPGEERACGQGRACVSSASILRSACSLLPGAPSVYRPFPLVSLKPHFLSFIPSLFYAPGRGMR